MVGKPVTTDTTTAAPAHAEHRAAGEGRVWGYARVSTADQDPSAQFEALRRAGVPEANIVTEHASGARQDRPVLTALLASLDAGDVLTVWKLDRLGRSVSHLVNLIDDLGRRGVQFRSLTDPIDTTSAQGRLMNAVIAAIAAFERELIRERTLAGLQRARAKQKQLGRPSRVNARQYALIHQMAAAGQTRAAICETTGLSRSVVGRVLRDEITSLRRFSDRLEDGELPLYGSSS